MKYVINRFEGTYAICEDTDKKIVEIPKYRLPLEAKEGTCVAEEDGFYKVLSQDLSDRGERTRK